MATSRRKAAKKGNVVSLDLSNVEARVDISEGEHRVSVVEVTQEEGDKAPYFAWKLKCTEDDDAAGGVLYTNTSTSEASLWNLRTLLEALGVDIPDEPFDLDLNELVGLELMVQVEKETYEGKKRPRIADFWAAEEEKPKGKTRRGKKDDDEDEAPKRTRRGAKKDDDDEPVEEETTKPRGRSSAGSRKSSKKKATVSEDDIADMSEDELQDLVDAEKLDLDLGDLPSLRKMRAAVIDAAQEAGIIEEGEADDEPEEEEEKPARRRRTSRR